MGLADSAAEIFNKEDYLYSIADKYGVDKDHLSYFSLSEAILLHSNLSNLYRNPNHVQSVAKTLMSRARRYGINLDCAFNIHRQIITDIREVGRNVASGDIGDLEELLFNNHINQKRQFFYTNNVTIGK